MPWPIFHRRLNPLNREDDGHIHTGARQSGHGLVPGGLFHGVGQQAFSGGVGVGFVVGVAVFVAVAEFFHEFGGGVAQVHRHFAAFVGFDKGPGFVVYLVASLIFGGYG